MKITWLINVHIILQLTLFQYRETLHYPTLINKPFKSTRSHEVKSPKVGDHHNKIAIPDPFPSRLNAKEEKAVWLSDINLWVAFNHNYQLLK